MIQITQQISFPNDFNNLSKKDKKNFIGEFIYYKLLLDELKDEQKKYKKI